MEKKVKYTANYLASSFLLSRRSLKKIYKLTATSIAILRYVCDSIDLNFKKNKKFETKLHQSQIAKFVHSSRKTVNQHLLVLISKKLLKYDNENYILSCGQVLISCGQVLNRSQRQEV